MPKQTKTKSELEALISEELKVRHRLRGVGFVTVQWHERDAQESNWSAEHLNPGVELLFDVEAALQAVVPNLQAKYDLVE